MIKQKTAITVMIFLGPYTVGIIFLVYYSFFKESEFEKYYKTEIEGIVEDIRYNEYQIDSLKINNKWLDYREILKSDIEIGDSISKYSNSIEFKYYRKFYHDEWVIQYD